MQVADVMLQDRMSETLSQSLTSEEDEAVHAELDAMEASSLQEQMDALPEVPKVSAYTKIPWQHIALTVTGTVVKIVQ